MIFGNLKVYVFNETQPDGSTRTLEYENLGVVKCGSLHAKKGGLTDRKVFDDFNCPNGEYKSHV